MGDEADINSDARISHQLIKMGLGIERAIALWILALNLSNATQTSDPNNSVTSFST
ncbi:hypothetical protein [Iningainema tapete]|uniref:Uncharacterized protein n=1 Tax=Iningainema tapete BLCC-T55 TaxID=2748662 RepID=A0A8J6Y0T2_9CYAN|nr:hypothetical protein [Iningainema tapete]MBD2777058.1 hypothetical protein [Iningainema tapete BLCC-T55]